MPKKKEDKSDIIRKNVQFVGLTKLDPVDQKRIKEIIFDNFIKLERELKNIRGLKLHFKEHKIGGRRKCSVHLTINAATGPLTVDKIYSGAQWDPIAATHDILKNARQRIIHQYKTNSSYRKPYEKGAL